MTRRFLFNFGHDSDLRRWAVKWFKNGLVLDRIYGSSEPYDSPKGDPPSILSSSLLYLPCPRTARPIPPPLGNRSRATANAPSESRQKAALRLERKPSRQPCPGGLVLLQAGNAICLIPMCDHCVVVQPLLFPFLSQIAFLHRCKADSGFVFPQSHIPALLRYAGTFLFGQSFLSLTSCPGSYCDALPMFGESAGTAGIRHA